MDRCHCQVEQKYFRMMGSEFKVHLPVQGRGKKKGDKETKRDTDTSVIILSNGTTNALGSVVHKLSKKIFLDPRELEG